MVSDIQIAITGLHGIGKTVLAKWLSFQLRLLGIKHTLRSDQNGDILHVRCLNRSQVKTLTSQTNGTPVP
jgi:thymidylate kinase